MGWSEIKGWYYGKSKLEKVLLCCVSFLVVLIIVLFVCFLTSHDNEVCTNPECIRASVHLLDSVDLDADPCEDFYAFACGNFVKNAFSKGHPTSLYALNELTTNQLKQIVVEDRNNSDLPRTVVFQRQFYKACMDTEEIEKHGDERIFNLLDEVVGGWPILKMANWNEANYDWKKPMIAARKLGLFHQFFISVELYHNYTKQYTNGKSFLWLRPPSSTEIVSFHFNDTSVEFIHNIAKLLGADSVDVKQELRITNTFAENLRVIAEKYENKTQNSKEKTKISIKEIDHKLLKVDWLNFLRDMTGIHLSGKEKVIFDIDDYLTDLYYLFHRTHKKDQANFVAWIILSTNINYLPEKIRDQYDEILINDENKKESSRKDQCYKLSTGLFKMIAESEYIRRYTTPVKKHEIQSMIDYIKAEMKDAIKSTQWIDIHSRSNALRRLENVTTYIGWLDVAFNLTKLEELTGFNKVKHFPENGLAIDMAMVALKTKYDKFYSQIHHKINELETLTNPKVEVNAYYMYKYNVLILPAPILQGIIFNLHRPNYMNYGALGSVIGHELTHGFSIMYEKNEDDDYEKLWTNGTLEKRGEIVECIKNSYDDFSIEQGRQSDNSTSTEENIADFNGVNLAYNAYRNWIRDHGGEPALPGIKFTPNQIFWIMASTYMCYEPELADKDTVLGKDKYHGAPKFRVLGRIINSPYFAYDFKCPEGSKMNPREKCRIFI